MTSTACRGVTDHGDAVEPAAASSGRGESAVLSLVRCDGVGRIDLRGVATRVRHLVASAEPARVFSQLASICVPGVADTCIIELSERGGHRYRIRQPAGVLPAAIPTDATSREAVSREAMPLEAVSLGTGSPGVGTPPVHAISTIGSRSVTVRFASAEEGCQSYTGVLFAQWLDDHHPSDADAALLALLVDHATALVERERLTARVADLQDAAGQQITLPAHQRIAAAVGILMSLHHLSAAQAADLLTRASHHTSQSIGGVADTVLRTGAMPEHPHHPTVSESTRVEDASPLR